MTVPTSFFIFVILTAIGISSVHGNGYDSASCISRANTCYRSLARKGSGCMPFVWPMEQPSPCKYAACSYCKSRTSYPCGTISMKKVCKSPSSPRKTMKKPKYSAPTPSKGKKGMCGYHSKTSSGGTAIVVNMGSLPAKDGWARIRRNGMSGLIYRPDRNGGRDSPGKKGKYCFPMMTTMSGDYQLTSISYTPHETEHNDMWVRCSLGFTMWYEGRYWKSVGPRDWLKAYQNVPGRMADYLHTKDHDPHKFIVKNVKAGTKFEVCISGRSYRYEVYRIVLKKCKGNECRGFPIQNLMGLPTTPFSC